MPDHPDKTPQWVAIAPHIKEVVELAAVGLVDERDKCYPVEAVGILCLSGEVFPLINQARSPKRFEVNQKLVSEGINALLERGRNPIAVYHSHPEAVAEPSDRDQMLMKQNEGTLHVIVGNDGIAVWMWDGWLRLVTKIPLPKPVPDGEHT